MLIVAFCLLIILSHNYCSSNCNTCINYKSYYQDDRCTSCPNNYFLYSYKCYSCNQYTDSSCNTSQNSNQDIAAIAIPIVICIACITCLCCCLRFLYKKIKQCFINQPVAPQNNQLPVMRLNYSDSNLAYHPPPPVSIGLPQISIHSFMVQTHWMKASQKYTKYDQNCVICLQSSIFLQTHCLHGYHPICIWQWASKKHGACPLCKSNNLFPMKIFCRKCLVSYYQVDVRGLENLSVFKRWQDCKDCSQ